MRQAFDALVRPVSTRKTILASMLVLAGYLGYGFSSDHLNDPWKVDEGQRIAEGYFWRLIRRGDVSHPDWFRTITTRSHPPVAKYFYGAVVDTPPQTLELVHEYDRGFPPDEIPDRLSAEYLQRRRPARIASFVCNALSAVIVFGILMRLTGWFAALTAEVLLVRHYLFASMLFYARSDTLQTFCTTATLAPLLLCVTAARARAGALAAAVAGALAALAFQTRLNGGVALLMCVAFLIAHERSRRTVAFITAAVVAFAFVSIVISPFYWAACRPAADVPVEVLKNEALPLRLMHRFELQVNDLRKLAQGVEPQWHLRTLTARIRFAFDVLASGKAGWISLLGAPLAVVWSRRLSAPGRAAIVWALTGIVVIALWIPLAWEPYLLIVLPAWVLCGAIGVQSLLRVWATR